MLVYVICYFVSLMLIISFVYNSGSWFRAARLKMHSLTLLNRRLSTIIIHNSTKRIWKKSKHSLILTILQSIVIRFSKLRKYWLILWSLTPQLLLLRFKKVLTHSHQSWNWNIFSWKIVHYSFRPPPHFCDAHRIFLSFLFIAFQFKIQIQSNFPLKWTIASHRLMSVCRWV